MQGKYIFSPGTPEGEALKRLTGNERVAILQATSVYKDAVDEAMDRSHPRAKALRTWLERDPQNKDWYDQNNDKLKLVENGLEINGDVFELEDEKAEDDGNEIRNDKGNTYFTFDAAQKYAESIGKSIPADWKKYIELLPGDVTNRLRFLTEVLGLRRAGCRLWVDNFLYSHETDANYWSSTQAGLYGYHISFNNREINPTNMNYREFGFTLRCIKKQAEASMLSNSL